MSNQPHPPPAHLFTPILVVITAIRWSLMLGFWEVITRWLTPKSPELNRFRSGPTRHPFVLTLYWVFHTFSLPSFTDKAPGTLAADFCRAAPQIQGSNSIHLC